MGMVIARKKRKKTARVAGEHCQTHFLPARILHRPSGHCVGQCDRHQSRHRGYL